MNEPTAKRDALSLLQINALVRAAESAGISPAAVSEMVGQAQRELFASLGAAHWPEALFDAATETVGGVYETAEGERFWSFDERELQEFARTLTCIPPVEPPTAWALVPLDDWRTTPRATARQ
jgi:hypothetical protein